MIVAVGSDHRGITQRSWVVAELERLGHQVLDMGTHQAESCDYPDIAAAVAQQVRDAAAARGVLICGTGIGVSIAANKIHGIRAAVCHDVRSAELSRQHNNANVLCLPGDTLAEAGMRAIVAQWMSAEFEGGRHQRRIDKIAQLEAASESC